MMSLVSFSMNVFKRRFSVLLCLFFVLLGNGVNANAAKRTSTTPLSVKSQPSNTTTYEQQAVSFSISATSGRTITYTWYKNGVAIGINSRSYSIASATLADAGTYTCSVTDGVSTYACTPFTLAVNQIVRITQQPANQMMSEGSSVLMSVTATGTGPLSYQWYLNGTVVTGGTTNTLAFSNVQPSNAGSYYCIVRNAGSSATSSTATLSVLAAPKTLSVALRWSAPTMRTDGTVLVPAEIASYSVYQTDVNGLNGTRIATVASAESSYVVSGLTQGTYYFSATTTDINGVESIMSLPVATTVQ